MTLDVTNYIHFQSKHALPSIGFGHIPAILKRLGEDKLWILKVLTQPKEHRFWTFKVLTCPEHDQL